MVVGRCGALVGSGMGVVGCGDGWVVVSGTGGGQRVGVDGNGKGAGGGAGGSGRALRVVAVALGETVVVEVLWWRW